MLEKRKYNYLRFSVTDRCDFNCVYCRPRDRVSVVSHEDLLTHEEATLLIHLIAQRGVEVVRITGGEPLIRRNLHFLVEGISSIPGIREVTLTTNGYRFAEQAQALMASGISRINFSLDTLKRDRFCRITGVDALQEVWKGIKKALELKLDPVKLNVVLFKGINDDEVISFMNLTKEYPICVRFIEYMDINRHTKGFVPVSNREIWQMMVEKYDVHRLYKKDVVGEGPAVYAKIHDAPGSVGFINSYAHDLCISCNRLRLTCKGSLYACLLSPYHVDLREAIRGEGGLLEASRRIDEVICQKEHIIPLYGNDRRVEMSYLGG